MRDDDDDDEAAVRRSRSRVPQITIQSSTPPPEANEQSSLLSPLSPNLHRAAAAAGDSAPPSPAHSITHGGQSYFLDSLADGILDTDRQRFVFALTRNVSFAVAILCCLCAGSITAYSLYAPLFQTRLKYSQLQVNTISIVAEVALYLPVPLVGLLCDRKGPKYSALLASVFFGAGYFLAAFTYRAGPPPERGGSGWPFGMMILSFLLIGVGTCSLYLAAVTTCAKNFGRGKHKGFALAAPIASFGLGGMWQSQVGAHLLAERRPDGSKGPVDVFRYFVFLGALLLAVGLVGALLLRVVDEGELVLDAVDSLERSGLLDSSAHYRTPRPRSSRQQGGYGTVEASTHSLAKSVASAKEDQELKAWLLNGETRRFLADPTMWFLAAGFFLVTGPGEAFINNLGTLIGTFYPGPHTNLPMTAPATHVSIVAVTSTAARILAGTLSDFFSPPADPHHHHHHHHHDNNNPQQAPQRPQTADSLHSSISSLDPLPHMSASGAHAAAAARHRPRASVSRVAFLLASTALLSVATLLLATGALQRRAQPLFWLVSALVGTGYGAAFSLVPIIISVVWGVENFGTNWGIVAMAPAGGAAVFGWLYAVVYEAGTAAGWGTGAGVGAVAARGDDGGGGDNDDGDAGQRCFGRQCYVTTAWAMTAAVWAAMVLWTLGWRLWRKRGIVV